MRKAPPQVTVVAEFSSIKIRIGGVLHVCIPRERLAGLQSWRMDNEAKFSIEFTLVGAAPILCEYDSKEKFVAVLNGLDAIL